MPKPWQTLSLLLICMALWAAAIYLYHFIFS